MRYRIGEDPAISSYGSTDEFVTFTVVLCLVIGAVLSWLGWYGRQWWLFSWNIGLIVASIAYLAWNFLPHTFGS